MNLDGALFDRQWAVTIGLPGQEGSKYVDIRVTFEIEKTSDAAPNKGKVEIYNLSSDSIKKFQKGMQLRLDAGYKNLIETLYIGDIVKSYTKRNQQEVVTTFEVGDSERQLINAHYDRSYGAGTSNIDVLQDLAKALGVSIGPVIGLTKVVYNSGVSFSGSVRRALEKMTKGLNLEFSVQNGVLQIIPLTAHNGDEAIVLSQSTGLTGIPSQGDGFVQFACLLNPKIHPGVPIQIISETPFIGASGKPVNSGFFKVRKAKIEGDTHGDKWGIQGEAVPINARQIQPMNKGTNFSTAVG